MDHTNLFFRVPGDVKETTNEGRRERVPWGPLGEVVYLRTYSRWDEEGGRRESWQETVSRVVDYSLSLVPEGLRKPFEEEDRRALTQAMMGLKAFVAGRTLWVGGSKHAEEFPLANYNCSFLDFKDLSDVYETVILLMSGAGVGFRVTDDNISQLNRLFPLKDFVEVEVEPYKYVGKPSLLEKTVTERVGEYGLRIVVGDSREGWADAIVLFLKAYSYDKDFHWVKKIIINTDYVRPLGTRLKRFGGYASGPEVLVELFLDAQKVLSRNPAGLWTQTKALDIMNLVGRTVVAGGTRRCLPAGTLVYTEYGPKRIEEVQVGDKVMTLDGWHSVTERMYQGEQWVLEIKTTRGSILCTPSHRLAVLVKGGGIAWVTAGTMTLGAQLLFYSDPWFPVEGERMVSEGVEEEVSSLEKIELEKVKEFTLRPAIDRIYLLLSMILELREEVKEYEISRGPYHKYKELPGLLGEKFFLIPKRLDIPEMEEFLATLGIGISNKHDPYNPKTTEDSVVLSASEPIYSLISITLKEGRVPSVEEIEGFISNSKPNVTLATVLEISHRGMTETYDLSVDSVHMFIADGFVVHNSAQIALGSDEDFAKAKTGNWWEKYPWRTSSNNSILFHSRPSLSTIEDLLDMAMQYGEPGFINAETASIRRENFRGVNPCSEILLDDSGVCNLVTVNLPAFIREDWDGEKKVDRYYLEVVLRALTRHAVRISLLRFPERFEHWNLVQERDRLIGVSFTGYGNFVDLLSHKPNSYFAEFLSWMRGVVHDEAKRYAAFLGIREPILKTTVKPEGTISLLPGVSSGVHPDFAPYYMRRIRMSKTDAVAQALKALGMTPYPAPETGAKTLEEAHTWVYEFPVASPAKKTQDDYTALEQLERYKLVMEKYADHNVSITVRMDPSEIKEVAKWVYDNWYSFVGVSFLRKSRDIYPLMPLEEITREQYLVAKASLPDLSKLKEVVDAIERGEYKATDDLDPSCDSGVCPIR
jgi:hypothetical protein